MYIATINRIPTMQKESLPDKKLEFTRLPREWTGSADWPFDTTLCCYSCGFNTNRRLFFVPLMYSEGKFIRGNNPVYCHPACALWKLLHSSKTREEVDKNMHIIKDFTKAMTDYAGEIVPSMNPESLERYGGTTSDRDFQNHIYNNNPRITKALYRNDAAMHEELNR